MVSIKTEESSKPDEAKLSHDILRALGTALADVRTTLLQVQTPGVSPLAALDATALDALKDIYYTANTEDPLNVMPARYFVLEQGFIETALLPLVIEVNFDSASEANQKRWSVPIYYALRLLFVLSLPISVDNNMLPPGSRMDQQLLRLRREIAYHPGAVQAFVSLLQYYIERKAEKQAALASAEQSKLEDARIDSILRFFRNLLCPLRKGSAQDFVAREAGVHLAIVGALVHADFYSTLAILFSTKEDAKTQYNEVVFLVADIYAFTYRYSSPRQMYRSYKQHLAVKEEKAVEKGDTGHASEPAQPTVQPSVFDKEVPNSTAGNNMQAKSAKNRVGSNRASSVRAALLRERATVGGSRATTTTARWTSRHSGGIMERARGSSNQALGSRRTEQTPHATPRNASIKRVVSARRAVQSKLSLNPNNGFLESMKINSDILCMLTVSGRTKTMKTRVPKTIRADMVRKDLQDEGVYGAAMMTNEFIEISFPNFVEVLRTQITELKSRALGDQAEMLLQAQKSFVTIVGSVVGFQREKCGKVFKNNFNTERSLSAQIHENCMDSVLASDFKIAKEWKPVESGIELETFQLVFRTLVDGFQSVKHNLKEEKKAEVIEEATFAILEMMKLLQSMATSGDDKLNEFDAGTLDANGEKKTNQQTLSPREFALNTLEELFEEPDFLNAPAELARDFSTKLHSYKHLSNVVEVTHAFTKILLNEKELAQLRVVKKKRKQKKEKEEKEDDQTKKGNKEDSLSEETKKEINSEGKEKANDDANTKTDSFEESHSAGAPKLPEENDPERENVVATEGDKISKDTLEDTARSLGGNNETGADSPGKEGNEQNGDNEDDSSDDESEDDMAPQLREVESIGIIKRFATGKAIQSLLLPLRSGLCKALLLSGSVHSVPDGADPLLSPVVIAKAAHVLTAIWKVAKSQERGALCGSFFTYGTMHFLSTVLEAAKRDKVLKHSVLERSSVLASDVAREFFLWLKQGPSLALDIFFIMDKTTCNAYATTMYRKDMLRQEKKAEESESEIEMDSPPTRRGNIDFEVIERRVSARKAKMDQTSKLLKEEMAARRRAERGLIEEDEDVDDIDNLDIGGGLETSESERDDDAPVGKPEQVSKMSDEQHEDSELKESDKPKSFCRLAKKKQRASVLDALSSDDENPKPIKRKRPNHLSSIRV